MEGRRATACDSAFVGAIVFLSFVAYVGELGFYSDDWDLLAKMAGARDTSFAGIFSSIDAPLVAMRPGQVAYFSLLFKAFGLNPFGYHVVNGIVLIALAIVCYMVLRGLGESRAVAVSIALVYSLSPNYSTDRFWFAAFAHTLSMVLYGVSLYATLRSLRAADRLAAGAWATASAAALALSALCFEVPLPFFLITAFVIWRAPCRPVGEQRLDALRWARGVNLTSTLVTVGAMVAFKLATARRFDSSTLPFSEQVANILSRAFDMKPAVAGSYGLNVRHALEANFGEYGIRLPQTVATIAGDMATPALLFLCGFVLVLVFAYLYVVAGGPAKSMLRPAFHRHESARLMVVGITVFCLGYAIFLTNSNIQFTPTGIGNRANIGAALGVALVLVSIAHTMSGLLPVRPWRTPAFCLLIAALCGSELLIDNAIAAHWVAAYRREGEILASIHKRIPVLPPQSTVILAGTCPYDGPAIVFESNWDLAGALRLMYGDATLNADVATSHLEVDERGVTTMIYSVPKRYEFGESVILYDYDSNAVTRLTDSPTARAHLIPPNGNRDCPPGYEGLGSAAW